MSPGCGTGLLLCGAAMALFCAMDALVKMLGASLPTFEIVFLRFAGGAFWLALFVLVTRQAWPRRAHLGFHAMRGALSIVTAGSFFYALAHLPLAIVTALALSAPVYVSLFGVLFLKEKASARLVSAVALGLIGTLVVALGGNAGAQTTGAVNVLAWITAIFAPITYAASLVMMKHQTGQEGGPAIVFAQAAIAAAIALPLAMPGFVIPVGITAVQAVLVGLLGAGAFLLLVTGIKRLPATIFALVDYTSLLWAALYGYVLFREVPGLPLWIGGGLIIAACFLGMSPKQKVVTEPTSQAG